MTFNVEGKTADSVLQPQSLKIVTFWRSSVKVECRSFQKAFEAFLAGGYCFIPSAVEGQVCNGRRCYDGTASHIEYIQLRYGLIKNTTVGFCSCFCIKENDKSGLLFL